MSNSDRLNELLYPHPLWRFAAIARMLILRDAAVLVALALGSPESLSALLVDKGGVYALGVIVAMAAMTVIGIIDLVINDCLPSRFALTWARRNRHTVYAAMGACYLAHAFAIASVSDPRLFDDILLANYLLMAGGCAWFVAAAAKRPELAL